MRILMIFLTGALLLNALIWADAQPKSEMKALIAELQVEETSDQATSQISLVAAHDADARLIVASNVPSIIHEHRGRVQLNAARLAGALNITDAIPALVDMLKDPMTKGGPITLYSSYTLADDTAGRALAKIGQPAILAVTPLLANPDRAMRYRAVLVLGNMDLPFADVVLRGHLPKENDNGIRRYIQARLRSSSSGRVVGKWWPNRKLPFR